MRLNEHLAQTGRTERLLQKAEELAKSGRRVLILCATQGLADALQARRIGRPGKQTTIKAVKIPNDFNWETMQPKEPAMHTVYLVDHHTAEQEVLRLQAKIAHFELLKMQVYQLTL